MKNPLNDNFRRLVDKYRNEKDFTELVHSSFSALLVRLLGVGTGFLVTLITSRYFGANALGLVSICMGVLVFATVFGKLGFDVALMRFVAGYQSKGNPSAVKGVYLTSLKYIVPLCVTISFILYFSADWMAVKYFGKPHLAELLRLNAWMTLPLVVLTINAECLRGLRKIPYYTFFQTGCISLLAVVLLIGAMSYSLNRVVPAYVQFISITLSALVSIVVWFRFSKFGSTKAEFELPGRELIRVAGPMFTTTLMQLLMSWAGTLILASYTDESDVGVYNALVRISVFTNITILAVNSLAMPRFAESFTAGDNATLKRHAMQAARLIFITALPLFVILLLWPRELLTLFGKEFPGKEEALYVLLAGQFIVAFAGLPSQILNMTGRQHILRNISIFSAIINVGACLLLIPPYGLMGTCYAQLLGTFAWNLLCVLSIRSQFGFYTFFNPAFLRRRD